MGREFLVSVTSPYLVALSHAAAPAQSITATAVGSPNPTTVPGPATVINGDFAITNTTATAPVADGIDEDTTWTLDFTADVNFPSFPPVGGLSSALLTMTLTPGNGGISTDSVFIVGLPNVFTSVIQALPVGLTDTV